MTKSVMILNNSLAELATIAAVASSLSAMGALVVASLSYRAQQPRIKVFLRLEEEVSDADLVVEVANSGRVACTVLRVGFACGRRTLDRRSALEVFGPTAAQPATATCSATALLS